MSTFAGSDTGKDTDSALQLAPVGEKGPDFSELKKSFEQCLADNDAYRTQCAENFETRYALWPGQSSDGKKHARAGNGVAEIVPWEGASDLRVFLTDEAINSKVAMLCTAFRKANVVAVPVEGNDLKRAKTVSNFMRWLVQTQIPEIDREVELLANYIQEKGVAVTGQFWEEVQEKTLVTLTLDQLQEQFPNIEVSALLADEIARDQLAALLEEHFGCTGAKAKKMLRELEASGKTTVPTLGKKRARPVIRAFNLDEDLFIPAYATDLENAPAIYRVQYFTPEKLRTFAHTDGWDQMWIEAAIESCRGKSITFNQTEYQQPRARSLVFNQTCSTDLIAVVYAYQRLSDEDGYSGLYLTVFNPLLPPDQYQDGCAKYGLVGYAHGNYPFILHRREYLSRKLNDSRGIPEVGKSVQDMVKAHRDGRIDAASVSISPPMMYPMGRPPGKWGAGARVPERRPGEYHWDRGIAPDMNTEKSEEVLLTAFNRYFGFVSRDTDTTYAGIKVQQEVNKFLSCWEKAMQQVFSLFQQFGSEEVFFRVVGSKQADPEVFKKGALDESFDYRVTYDILSSDMEQMSLKWKAILEGIQLLNREGNVNFAETLQAYVESIDPNIAERILDPADVGRQKVVEQEQNDLSQIFAGISKNIRIGTPPQLAIQVIQNYVQAPDVQARLQNDQSFRERVEARFKQYQMQTMQEENKMIGTYGAKMPGNVMQ